MKEAALAEDDSFSSPGNGGSARKQKADSNTTLGLLLLGLSDPDIFVKSSGTHPPPGLLMEMPPYAIQWCISAKNLSKILSFRTVRVQYPRGYVLFQDLT